MVALIGPRLDPLTDDLQDQQLAALNRALTAEVLRHAETRQKLLTALTWCWFKERLEPVEVVRQVPVIVERVVPVIVERPSRAGTPCGPRHWKPGPTRQRGAVKFPLAVAERTGLAAVIQRPLLLRSRAELDPLNVAVRRGGQAAVFPDSSWLVLSALAQRPGEFVPRDELEAAIYGVKAGGSVRSAIHRAKLTLASVGAEADLEATRVNNRGLWRLMLAEER